LTFGGWNQSKLLGSRIADLLTTGRKSIISEPKQAARRPVRIVIHSSPFQRCIQTSVGIAAGILQHDRAAAKTAATHGDLARSTPESTLEDSPLGKPLLRVDAFLGEWLSPDYFRDITPPPSSPLMVLSAKADLLADDDVEFIQPTPSSVGNFPGGWTTTTQTDQHDDAMSLELTTTLSRHRSNSYGQVDAIDADDMPTNPSYATSPSDPIPRGYVVHARSTCLELDRNWDSSREPASFGTGGEFGEEWSAMHDRLGTGICKLIAWYREHVPEAGPDPATTEDDNALLVIILVTHNTGCNALLRALTNRPVLIDVDQASLTVAVRKSDTVDDSSNVDPERLYSLKIRASTDHLKEPIRPLPFGTEGGGIKGLWTLRRQVESASSQQSVGGALSVEAHNAPSLWQGHHLTKRRWTTSTR
jgi:broad specificity phosphatase PhoE